MADGSNLTEAAVRLGKFKTELEAVRQTVVHNLDTAGNANKYVQVGIVGYLGVVCDWSST